MSENKKYQMNDFIGNPFLLNIEGTSNPKGTSFGDDVIQYANDNDIPWVDKNPTYDESQRGDLK